jgi:Holliday junction resolvasome RuvABC DNA-binding subunit
VGAAVSTVAADAREALVGLGWKPAIARAAVAAALAELDEDAPLPQVIREALRRCR